VRRLQVINVYDSEYESAGAFWPHVHGRIIAALILEHITLIGIFLIKGPVAFVETPRGRSVKSKILRYVRDSCSSTPFMIALPILTLIFHHYCKKRFEAAFKNYPLEVSHAKAFKSLSCCLYSFNFVTHCCIYRSDISLHISLHIFTHGYCVRYQYRKMVTCGIVCSSLSSIFDSSSFFVSSSCNIC